MSGGGPLIDLGNLSQPATTLINRVSDAVGGIAKPWQMKRVARAEAEVEEIKAATHLKLQEQEERALHRMIADETRKQENIENITYQAASNVGEDAKPDQIEEDWLNHFFDKSKNVSDAEMQSMWAKLLSGEASQPGSFSKRSIDLVGALDKRDAQLFTKFCTFACVVGGLTPIVFNEHDDIYTNMGIDFESMHHLDDLGLIHFQSVGGYKKNNIPRYFAIHYFSTPLILEFQKDKNELEIGKALFTKVGQELAPISGPVPSGEFLQYMVDKLVEKQIAVSSTLAAKAKWVAVNKG